MPENENPLTSLEAYELFIYSLPDRFPSIRFSTLILVRHGVYTASVEGGVCFEGGIVLSVIEEIDFTIPAIQRYSYQVERDGHRLYWYDPWPHPADPTLASTHPHHKHIHPDIKHHRIPAPGLRFDRPNLPLIITEIQRNLL
ncbi:MAG: hypothetical protein DRI77_11700 [Chloroflexi bacterium]|nr:MAG: hypothetical protein DRI77_11700 [Chloroflexota bacterium]